MVLGSISRRRRACIALTLAVTSCIVCRSPLIAQAPPPTEAAEPGASKADGATSNEASDPAEDPERGYETIGGGGELVRGPYVTSPLEKLGSDILLGTYFVGAFSSLVYFAVVYPLQALFGSSKVEPVMLWLLVPVAGPWVAQTRSTVESKPFWRVVLISDGVLQAGGLVLGLIGLALSGRRSVEHTSAARIEWNVGVPGAGLTGVTLTVHTL